MDKKILKDIGFIFNSQLEVEDNLWGDTEPVGDTYGFDIIAYSIIPGTDLKITVRATPAEGEGD